MKKEKRKKKKYSGFSFIELMVAIFILSVIMTTTVSVFASVVLARKNATKNLNDVSAGREAIQIMAKNMRVSSQLNYVNVVSDKSIYFFNSAKGLCVSYRFSNNSLYGATAVPGGSVGADCSTASVAYAYSQMIDPDMVLDGSFRIIPTDNTVGAKVVGRGTITMIIDGEDSLQTTVSFLDYGGVIN